MTRSRLSPILLALALAACGGKKASTTPQNGSGSDAPIPAKRIVLSWGITPKGELADIYLATTDETGKQISHAVGTYKGTCTPFKPAPEMKAITGVSCTTGGGGTEIHAVVQGGEEIIVLQLGTNPGETPDPMSRVEVTRVKVPLGIAIDVEP